MQQQNLAAIVLNGGLEVGERGTLME